VESGVAGRLPLTHRNQETAFHFPIICGVTQMPGKVWASPSSNAPGSGKGGRWAQDFFYFAG